MKQEQVALLNHIALQVKDLKRSGIFYEQILGLKSIPEPFKDGLHLWFSIGHNTGLHLIQSTEPLILPGKTTHFCFSVKDLEEFMKSLEEYNIFYGNWEGVPKIPTVRGDGIKQIFFQDPDGYWLEMNNDHP